MMKGENAMPGPAFAITVSILVFTSVALLTYAAARALDERRTGAWRLARLTRMTPARQPGAHGGAAGSMGQAGLLVSATRGLDTRGPRGTTRSPLRLALALLARAFENKSYAARIERELARADIPLRGSEFVAINLILIVVGFIVGFLLTRGGGFAFGLAVAGGFLPNAYVKWKQAGRLARLNSQIADALVIMANSLRAGYSFLQAMDMVSREMAPPISDEFSAAMKEMGLGAPTEGALTGLAERAGSEDMELVVTAVLIQRQVGGNLAEVLDNIAHTIRERVRIRAEIRTLTAQGRLSGIIIGVLPVALGCLLYAINPSYIRLLFTHPVGRIMVVMAAVGEIVGAWVIKRIITIEV